MARCCCGKIDFDDDHTPMVFNDLMHEVLGPQGNFCGPVITHTVRNLENRISALEAVLKKIAEWGCNGQCVELAGTQCPCCMAASALRRERAIAEVENDLS